ncbi:DNA repair protein RecN, partial [Streptococcus suis]
NLLSAMSDLQSLEDFDPDYKQLSYSLTYAYYVFEDITKRLSDVVDNLDFDVNRLMQLESRLDLLNTITNKYGGTVDDVLDYFSKIS